MKKSTKTRRGESSPELLASIPPQCHQYLKDERDHPSAMPSARREEPGQTPEEKASFLLNHIGNLIAKRILTVENELVDSRQRLSFLTRELESKKRQARQVDKERLSTLCSIQKEEKDLVVICGQLQRAQEYLPSPYIVPEHPPWDEYIALLNALRCMVEAFGPEAITNAMTGVKRKHQTQEKSIQQNTSREGVRLAEKFQKEKGISPWDAAGEASKKTNIPRRTIYNALREKIRKNKQ